MVRKSGNLTVDGDGANLDIGNGRIMLRLYVRDGGYVQEFHAKDCAGQYRPVLSSLHKNLIPASEHRVCASPMISGERPHLYGVCRESLRMVYSQASVIEHDERRVTVRLSGDVQFHTLNCAITIESDASHFHVSVDDTVQPEEDIPLVEYVMSAYAFLPGIEPITNDKPLDYIWAPVLRPGKDQLIGDRAFGSPAIIVQHQSCAAAIIPDLRALDSSRPMPAALDMDIANGLLPAPLLSYGLCAYQLTDDGCFCRHDVTMSRRLDPPKLSYAYYLLINADAAHCQAYREVSRFLWSIYGSEAIRSEPARPHHVLATNGHTGSVRPDHHTGMRLHTGREILQPAWERLDRYDSTGSRNHLARGLEALDQACLLQSVWRIPWREDPVEPGAVAGSNRGWYPDPVLAAQFARCAMRYGALIGDCYYFERGTAALRAALSAQGLNEAAQAAVDECVELIGAEYGSVYVHVGKRWGACASGPQIRRLDFARGEVRLSFVPSPNGEDHRRIVFGGLRGKTYKVRIDGRTLVCTREQMEAGISEGEL